MIPLHIHTTTEGGGAAQVARSLHRSQRENGVAAKYLAAWGPSDPAEEVFSFWPGRRIDRFNVAAYRMFAVDGPLNRQKWRSFLRSDLFRSADVIHLHNAHGYYLPPDILNLILQKPCVWTLHDFWLLTGRCAMPEDCTGYTRGCPSCPHLSRYPASIQKNTSKIFSLRRELLANPATLYTVPSEAAKAVFLAEGISPSRISTVLNPIDISPAIRSPNILPAKQIAKMKLGFHSDVKVVLFSARKLSEPRKGFGAVVEAISKLGQRTDAAVVFVGEAGAPERDQIEQLGVPTAVTGLIGDRDLMTDYFLAADIVLAPSKSETFGLIFVEAALAGAALIAGNLPVVREVLGSDGAPWLRLVNAPSAEEIATQLSDLLMNQHHPSDTDRAELMQRYDPNRAAGRYLDLYREVLSSNPPT